MGEKVQLTSLDQIDEPKLAMRSDAHDEDIEELAASIKSIGLLQPVLLRPVGDRFEIIAGHRRVTAARHAGLVVISSIVRGASDSEATVAKLHENLLRRDVNPVDEGIFLSKVMQEQNLDIKQIADMTKRSEIYIASRLEILDYPGYLIEAVGEKQISLGAAHWLNQIADERVRQSYVNYAIKGGISVRRARAWFESWGAGHRYANPLEVKETDAETGGERTVSKEQCVVCQNHDVPDKMMLYYAHLDCVEHIKI